jgi:diguanylate cyclase (GGDEF)-like protein/PAS domain S-box-containing protein
MPGGRIKRHARVASWSLGGVADERRGMTRTLAFVLFAGCAIVAAWLVLPHSRGANDVAVAAAGAGSLLCGALLLALPSRLMSDRALNAMLALVTANVSVGIAYAGGPDTGLELFYLWATPYAYFFFSRRHAALQTLWVSICFAAALALQPGASTYHQGELPGRWLLVVGSVSIVGVLVRRLAHWIRERETRFRRGFEDSPLGMSLVSVDLRYLEVNRALCQIHGRSREELLGLTVGEVTHPDDHDVTDALVEASATGEPHPQSFEKRYLHPDGRVVLAAVNASLVYAEDGRPMYYFSQVEDITERRRTEQELALRVREQRYSAVHDALTGLPNRTLALDRIGQALRRHEADGTTVAVLVLDLDRFQVINDSLGRGAGDDLLLAVAPRLRDAVDPGDTVARIGGDEFLVVCEGLDGPGAAIDTANRLAHAVRQEVILESGGHFVSASIGIAVAACPEDTAESLVRDADAAMHRVKGRDRGGYELFDEHLRKQVLARVRNEAELRHALDRGEMRVHYQPIVDSASGDIVSVEALVRWQHPKRGLVPPDDFIPIAEETGLIAELGRWVLREACQQVAAWQRHLDTPLGLCVNVSGRQIADPGFPREVARVMRESGLRPGTLGLEITETLLIEDAESAMTVLDALAKQDLRLVLDDFGTGYSSLSYLKRFPLDALKVDRSFIAGLGTDADDSAIVEAIVTLAHTLGLDVVAEGVETVEQMEQVRQLACPHAQGYLLSRPLPAERLIRFLTEARSRQSALMPAGSTR